MRKRDNVTVILVDWDGVPRNTVSSDILGTHYVKPYVGAKGWFDREWQFETMLPDGTIIAFEREVSAKGIGWLW